MLRPSLPIMTFYIVISRLNTDAEFSIVYSAHIRWMVWMWQFSFACFWHWFLAFSIISFFDRGASCICLSPNSLQACVPWLPDWVILAICSQFFNSQFIGFFQLIFLFWDNFNCISNSLSGLEFHFFAINILTFLVDLLLQNLGLQFSFFETIIWLDLKLSNSDFSLLKLSLLSWIFAAWLSRFWLCFGNYLSDLFWASSKIRCRNPCFSSSRSETLLISSIFGGWTS